METFDSSGVLERLAQLDGDLCALYGFSAHFDIVITRGSAFMLMGLVPDARVTRDIDVLLVAPEVERLLERYDMNTDVATFLYRYPQGWAKRRVRVPFDGDVLDVYTLSEADLVIMKLLSWRETDKQDLRAMAQAGRVDASAIQRILDDVTELRINIEDDEWSALCAHFAQLRSWSRQR